MYHIRAAYSFWRRDEPPHPACDDLVDLIIIHVASFLVLFSLVSFEDGAQGVFLHFLCRLAIKATSMNDLVVDIEFVLYMGLWPLPHTFR